MEWGPTFKLYQADGTTLVYWFEHVQNINGWPSDLPSNIKIENLRSQGSVNIPGGKKSYDITLQGFLYVPTTALHYTNLTTEIFNLQDAVDANTNYVIKLDKSEFVTDNLHVIRVEPIRLDDSLRNRFIKYSVTFSVLSW